MSFLPMRFRLSNGTLLRPYGRAFSSQQRCEEHTSAVEESTMTKTSSPVAAKSAKAPLADAFCKVTEQTAKIAQTVRQLIFQTAQLDSPPAVQQGQGQQILL